MTAQAPKLTAVDHQAELAEYARAGASRAAALPNRGPLRYAADGRPHPDIVARYWQFGFYVFERVVDPGEIDELRADIDFLLDHAPSGEGAALDRSGRPAYGGQFARPTFLFVRPLSDPWGGTKVLGGRHPTKMREPLAGDGAPEQVVHLINGMCQTMASGLRLYGHPDLLSIAAAINGDDFVPYNDAVFVKLPGLGGSVSWHQDGVTHWDSPNWDEGIHGFNFQVQIYECTPQVETMFAAAKDAFGRVDAVLNVAGVGSAQPLADITLEEYDRTMGVNLRGVMLGTKHGISTMVPTGGGVVLNWSSIGGINASDMPTSVYSATKAGVIAFTKAAAVEYGTKGIRANAICPGFVETPILASMPEKVVRMMEDRVPMGRLAKPEEIANTYAWLASDEASYINGAVIEVSGGVTI
jgi:NAD(P)-dependent dehydrogenase (short-subunit alcohol dehydrogenase family)